MATRYSGDLKITVVYDDRGDYRTSVSRGGKVLWRGRIRPPPAGFGSGVAYDSQKAYDRTAEAALAFADDEKNIGDSAEHDDSGYKIRRVKGYWEKWPGGRIKPKRMRSRDRSIYRKGAPIHVYATPEVKRTASYKRAERLENDLAPRKWKTPGLTRKDSERIADAWERAGFTGEADNYRMEAERRFSKRRTGPSGRVSTPKSRYDALYERYKAAHKAYEVSMSSARGRPDRERLARRMLRLEAQVRGTSPWRKRRARRDPKPRASKLSAAKRTWISEKIRTLRHEGYPPKQAQAIAYRMAGAAGR